MFSEDGLKCHPKRHKQFFKACVRYFSLFLKEQCVSWLFQTKCFEKKFNLQLFYLPTVSRTLILSWALPTSLKLVLKK